MAPPGSGIYRALGTPCELPMIRAMIDPPRIAATSLSQALGHKVPRNSNVSPWGSPVWRKALTPFGKFRRRRDGGGPRTTRVTPLWVVGPLPIVLWVGAGVPPARRAGRGELEQEALPPHTTNADPLHR